MPYVLYVGVMTNEHGVSAKALLVGIRVLLADDSLGKRSLPWLSKRTGIALSTLKRRLANPGDFTADELWAICDAFGVSLIRLHELGEQVAA